MAFQPTHLTRQQMEEHRRLGAQLLRQNKLSRGDYAGLQRFQGNPIYADLDPQKPNPGIIHVVSVLGEVGYPRRNHRGAISSQVILTVVHKSKIEIPNGGPSCLRPGRDGAISIGRRNFKWFLQLILRMLHSTGRSGNQSVAVPR